ncbi:NADPH-dependent FMN reductase [Streptomyces venezuelae]|uniref:NADPH-dependent FMN reductase n=1 Tax=Streptomyces venezuelae TaxID=54571 RepID=UPI00123DBAC7|nr:NAD(P)H-dependent oxidoreductase [Streptomyces venezuelae]QES15274.1 NADPH-dependent FMN reductase [Streptomyces venezuelae]
MDITNATTATVTAAPAAAPAPLTLALVVASDREGRFGHVVADWFRSRLAERQDFTLTVVDLAEVDLPTSLSYDPSPAVRAQLSKVTPVLEAADAFVVVTPEYNHSFPASLKNLIDRHYTEWQAKPVGFVSYGGISGGLRAVEQLRQVYAEMHAVTVRETVSFHHAQGLFDEDGRHKDPSAAETAAKALLDQLAWWGRALKDAKSIRPYGS